MRHRAQRLEVVFTARLTARLRSDAVIRSQVEYEILFLSDVVDLVAVWTHQLKAEIRPVKVSKTLTSDSKSTCMYACCVYKSMFYTTR